MKLTDLSCNPPIDFNGHPPFSELAEICNAVYGEGPVTDWILFCPQWRQVLDLVHYPEIDPKTFFAGVYYKRDSTGAIQHIVFAIGGTDFTIPKHDFNDLQIFMGKAPGHATAAQSWCKLMLEEVYKEFGKNVFDKAHGTLTGHSLGAFSAQMTFVMTQGLTKDGNYWARPMVNYVGFENPGIWESLVHICGSDQAAQFKTNNMYAFCKTINNRPNAVNSCQRPFGKMYYIQTQPVIDYQFTAPPMDGVPADPLKNISYYLAVYSFLDTHRIEYIARKLQLYTPQEETRYRRLHVIFGGYYEYCNYRRLEQADYWDEYCKWFWAHYVIQKHYDYDINRFKGAFYSQLNEAMNFCRPYAKALQLQTNAVPQLTQLNESFNDFSFFAPPSFREPAQIEEPHNPCAIVASKCNVL